MSIALSDHLDPWRAVRHGLAFAGEVELSQLPRLAEIVLAREDAPPARIDYRLRFERDPEGRALVIGHVRSCLRLPCQRCLGAVEIAVDAPLRLALVKTDQLAGELPDDIDPCVVAGDSLDLAALIEDELLLAIPAVPRHGEGLCQPPEPVQARASSRSQERSASASESGLDPSAEKPHPFAVLAGIRGVDKA